jgi:outer membrane protein OmpA-like peptidoglycan-associated protein
MRLSKWCPALTACTMLLPEAGAAQERVPLCVGLTIAGAVSEPEGDYEPIITVEGVDASSVQLRYAAETRTRSGAVRKVNVRRAVRRADLDSATLTMPWFNTRAAVTMPGTTAIGLSRAVLRALKATGMARVGLFDAASSGYPARRDVQPNMYEFEMPFTLETVPGGPRELSVLVNGVAVPLPVIQARGKSLGDQVELLLLDDEANPLALRFRMTSDAAEGAAAIAQVVKISYRCPSGQPTPVSSAASPLERSLLETGRAEVYDIYFDFNSDRIREQSEPTLREIGELLRRHPDWRLDIEGHTDSIASDRFNLELSARRAAAVKAALTGRYGIVEGRLTTSGAGESRPKERNATPEGRARNRRVELVRRP